MKTNVFVLLMTLASSSLAYSGEMINYDFAIFNNDKREGIVGTVIIEESKEIFVKVNIMKPTNEGGESFVSNDTWDLEISKTLGSYVFEEIRKSVIRISMAQITVKDVGFVCKKQTSIYDSRDSLSLSREYDMVNQKFNMPLQLTSSSQDCSLSKTTTPLTDELVQEAEALKKSLRTLVLTLIEAGE